MSMRQICSQEDTTFRALHLISAKPDITQRELAVRLGVSVGKVNYCLRAMAGRGLIKIQNFAQSKNKLGYVYVLTPAGISQKSALASQFLKRKMDEYESLVNEIVSVGGQLPASIVNVPQDKSSCDESSLSAKYRC